MEITQVAAKLNQVEDRLYDIERLVARKEQ